MIEELEAIARMASAATTLHASARTVAASRQVLVLAAGMIGEEPRPASDGVAQLVSTAVRFRPVPRESGLSLKTDADRVDPGLYTSLYLEERARRTAGGRIARLAAVATVAPHPLPLHLRECARLVDALEARGICLRLLSNPVFRDLTARERRRSRFLPLDEQLALGAILAAPGPVVATFSEDGGWPSSPVVVEAAEHRGRRIARFPLSRLPYELVRRLRVARYERLPAGAFGHGREEAAL
jgi:hypothetical protein